MVLKRIRKSFGKVHSNEAIPNLIQVQIDSYKEFLQFDVPAEQRKNIGLQSVFKEMFPVSDFSGSVDLDFVKYELDEPKYDVEECLKKALTYAANLRVVLSLVIWNIDETTGEKSIREVKDQEVFMGEIPLMTDRATFIFNGVERVVVSQMQRSPGVFFSHDDGKSHSSGKVLFSAKIIPYRGSWLDFEFDSKDNLYIRIDKKRKIIASALLKSLLTEDSKKAIAKLKDKEKIKALKSGYTDKDILAMFYETHTLTKDKKGWVREFSADNLGKTTQYTYDLVNAKTGELVLPAGGKINRRKAEKFVKEGLKTIILRDEDLPGLFLAEDLIEPSTMEMIAPAAEELTADLVAKINELAIREIKLLYIDGVNSGYHIRNTIATDKLASRQDALFEIYSIMRPGEPPTIESAEKLLQDFFFNEERYDLSDVGRFKMNLRFGEASAKGSSVLTEDDIFRTVKILANIKDGKDKIDDIDDLSNRRVRFVGELMENQYRMGLISMERSIRERMSSVKIETVMPRDLINSKPVMNTVKDFFGSSQLSQFMDQDNPLAEVTHKRRVSALGSGGITRDRAGFEVRDVHSTHYGRICPIETPEGANIGLINSLTVYSTVNKYGFIETPYKKVVNGKVTDEVVYVSAMEEKGLKVAGSGTELTPSGKIRDEKVLCRENGEWVMIAADEVDCMEVSPKQLVSVASALIPFLENDDANRALMGANMQRQAVPLIKNDAPFVGTGMEETVARDSKACVVALHSGLVTQVDSTRIVVQISEKDSDNKTGVDIYRLQKFARSNQDTCINNAPLVKLGDKVKKGDVLADGSCVDNGELALGKNVKVAFLSWKGFTYEDSIIISEKLVRDDSFTSIHIKKFEVSARDTKLGAEEITRDIPNIGEEALKNLDETGVVHIGAFVKAGDILVGKVTPKGETIVSPEEKLLKAIFGEKAIEVKDSSLRVPPGTEGTVIDVRMFLRKGIQKDERTLSIEQQEIAKQNKDRDEERRILEQGFANQLKGILLGNIYADGLKDITGKNIKITEEFLAGIEEHKWKKISVADKKVNDKIKENLKEYNEKVEILNDFFDAKIAKITEGIALLPGVLKVVRVFLAVKRKLQSGDKLAGRHGNKGIVSRIIPLEDMPYMENGEPVDMVLTPLGIPSRMNLGQILETHLGWAAVGMGKKIGQMLDQYKANAIKTEDLKDYLGKVYGDDAFEATIKNMKTADLVEFAEDSAKGLHYATPVFDGAHEEDITNLLKKSGLNVSGKTTLFDGQTGEKFDRDVTVGYIYMLKLHHLVDEKIHARSVGPYSLVTQQPLGGKAQFGGQRFGEMEVWALEAYGAAYTLQEMLTVKSDDVSGRTKVYESIVRGNYEFESGVPESFNVLLKEIKSLGLNIETKHEKNAQ
ncbi:MAG: DNA-directed RNA polymerase subunit beta [Rickettsiales bacterium]|jgi:DNA-directed RNA polymerase subunit beta|nr:DNA-directed RNA polymerase subunit beta [Rickettsiales bacterium]